MSSIDIKKNIVVTVMSKGLIMALNFAVIVLTTQLWGAEGRGSIAIFVADLGLISIFANVFTGSSISYFFSRIGYSKLSSLAHGWSLLVGTLAAALLYVLGQHQIAPFIFTAATLMGIFAFHNSLFVGSQRIDKYNLFTVLQPLSLLLLMLAFHWIWPSLGCYCYFFAQSLSLLILIAVCYAMRRKMKIRLSWDWDWSAAKEVFSFGWKTELSSLLQFFNYRLTYYVLDFYFGRSSVGVFSIGVNVASAIWIISQSMSMVQFSNVLKQGHTQESRKETMSIALVSLGISVLCLGAVVLLPASWFAFVFGPEFAEAKRVVLVLAPGILALAFSNVIGNYFSAIRHLNILIVKSAVGLVVTLSLAFVLVRQYAIDGACIVNSASYIVSSIVLLLYYFSKKSHSDIYG
ncbi:MAG: polysaccharide biosynthesis C-terminal domain-containing protein [Bacteroidales bacterium]|nr:polysaccharide biosynthesis C-terminal domain-containing protein [Bacteroidales bacterium]